MHFRAWASAPALPSLLLVACTGGGATPSGSPPADASADAALDAHRDAAGDTSDASDAACPTPSTFDPATAGEILVAGDSPDAGIFDPSFIYPADASTGAMAYSAVPDQRTIRTHVALSSDHGATWTLAVEANVPEAATIASTNQTECPGGSCSGNLISEVPSLVFDADEPDTTKQWKLFSHRYLCGPQVQLHYTLGTIVLQTAPSPSGPWTAPQKLLGWSDPYSTYSSTGVVTNVSSFPGMHDCLALTEPGALWRPGAIDLAVGCEYLAGTTTTSRIELLRSTDHGASWQYVGPMLRPSDASCVPGATGVNAADLFVAAGREYLSATPGATNGAYEGCLVFSVPDPTSGAVARDGAGTAIVARTIVPAPAQFAGACTFAEGVTAGYALDVGFFTPGAQRPFRILRPGVTLRAGGP
jgi:hypothetical protein